MVAYSFSAVLYLYYLSIIFILFILFTICFMLMIVLFTYFWSSDPLSHPNSHVSFSSSYFWSRHPVITLHLIPVSYTCHDYHPSPLSPHITQHNTSQLTHHHINTMTTSHSPADDGRKNSSESSCYAYIYCYFYVFTQLYKSLKNCWPVTLIFDAIWPTS